VTKRRPNKSSVAPDPARRPDPSELHERAEQKATSLAPLESHALSLEEIGRMLHELRVAQIELEAQNQELRAAREQLEVSQAHYFDLYNLAPVGYCTLSVGGAILGANLTVATLLGVVPSALIKRPLYHFIFQEDRDVYHLYRKRLKSGQPQACELRMVREDGGVFWARLETAKAQDEVGTAVHRIVISDISEQKRAEEERAAQKNLLDAVMETLPVGLALMDARGGTLRANPEFERIWGGPPLVETPFSNHSVYRGWWAASGQPVRAEEWASARALTTGETVVGQELVIQRFDGKRAFILNSAAPIRDAHGRIAGCSVAIMDITELKAIEKQLREAQKLESLGVLAGGIAHDFNNLLGSILSNSELAQQQIASGCPCDEEIRDIQNVAGRAAEIVRQMMAYAGQETAALESVDLSQLVGDMLQLLHISISKKVTLKMELKEHLPAVLANPAQIRQVIMNLITNASEAIGESGGVITIATSEVQPEDGAPASIQRLREAGSVRLEVSDTGCGMTEEIRAKIFDPFFTTKFAGRGLGLAAVDGIIRSHGGTINVASAPSRGSRFEVVLPRAGEPARDVGDLALPPPDEFGGFAGTILVVEDEEALRSALCKMLRRNGCTVIEAADGQAGVDQFRASTPKIDVVLLDLTLPGMSGGEVLGELRRVQPNVKVILTSAYSRDWLQNTVDGQQPWFYLRKPYPFSKLKGLMREVCRDQMKGGHAEG
jgi:PAS domain S-box-containing protein